MRSMDEMQIQRIVQRVLKEIAGMSQNAERTRKPSLVVFFCGCPGDLEKVSDELKTVRKDYRLVAGLSPAAESLIGREHLGTLVDEFLSDKDLHDAVDSAETVLFPNLSQNTAAKVLCGIRDSLGSDVMAYALQRGKRVLASRDCICPGEKRDPYSVFLQRMLEGIEKLGVALYSRGALGTHLLKKESAPDSQNHRGRGRPVVTVADVREVGAAGFGSLSVPKNAIVTSLARDEANKLHVEINREAF